MRYGKPTTSVNNILTCLQIYATSEERKQRNRQAQAAFRERRTEYIKQLEDAIRTHEQNLANLQAAHRHAADECLMLRYKNSLLERILLEKGTFFHVWVFVYTPFRGPLTLVPPPPRHRCPSRAPGQDGQSKSWTYSYAPELGTAASDSEGSLEQTPCSQIAVEHRS